ncbi:hypothetical protein KVR01_007897 [Diaporthe batatas]|uniref:uncharacterized protein n=1 Tax=Diaporthe batatas TaxID=748121 RepID=UPI001D039FB0|nr:uncharacterized protein KVR01_007897 [Diaporthe batatas]KAG8162132.1 hypothetical protein KVR01_007897 [Diaporthe batatas]
MATKTSGATPSPTPTPPPGTTPNLGHPETSKGPMTIAIGVVISLTSLCFLLRTYVRIWIKRTWTCEDWLALFAWIGTITYCGTGAATMAHHGGEHERDLTQAQLKEAYYWLHVARIHYAVAICVTKLAILCLYRRVFSMYPRSTFDATVIMMAILLVLYYVATVIAKIWECVPRSRAWDQSIPGHCIDILMLVNVDGVFNVVTDFIMVIMPLRVVWNMNMKFLKKVHVVLAFTFGMCAPAFSLVGTVVRIQGHKNPDKTWVQPKVIMWALAEVATGILCVSFPELGLLLRRGRRRPSMQASTGIREGRYREQNAAFNGMRRSLRTVDKWASRGGGKCEHVELDEVRLVNPPVNAVIVEGRKPVRHDLAMSSRKVEITRQATLDSASIV